MVGGASICRTVFRFRNAGGRGRWSANRAPAVVSIAVKKILAALARGDAGIGNICPLRPTCTSHHPVELRHRRSYLGVSDAHRTFGGNPEQLEEPPHEPFGTRFKTMMIRLIL